MLSDSIHYGDDSSKPTSPAIRRVLVYMIPGNPGLIEYYRDFLGQLFQTLELDSRGARFDILGQSLAGFEVDAASQTPPSQSILGHEPPFDLQEQVTYVQEQMTQAAESYHTSDAAGRLPVILIGHSVGAYILLDIIARQQAAQRASDAASRGSIYEIVGGICLFPTVVHIARSPTGRKVQPIAGIPGLAFAMQLLARLLCNLLPDSALLQLVRWVTGMPEASAQVTKAFLQSNDGVKQSIHMGKQELDQITDDKWDDEVWSSKSTYQPNGKHPPPDGRLDRPQLYFFWGAHDHWVENRTRDALVASRASSASESDVGKPRMEIDSQGLPHAFCIRQSEAVAEKVSGYVLEIMTSYSGMQRL